MRLNLVPLTYEELKRSVEIINDPSEFLLQETKGRLKSEERFEETIDSFRTYKQQRFFNNDKMNNYAKHHAGQANYLSGEETHYYNNKLKEYVTELPEKIQAIKQLKRDLKQLLTDADERAPSMFKTGNVKETIQKMVSPKDITKLLAFAEETRDNISINSELFTTNKKTY